MTRHESMSLSRLRRASLIVIGVCGSALVAELDGQIHFELSSSIDGHFYDAAVADLNGDGHLDIAAATPSGVQLYFNSGDGSLVLDQTLHAGSEIRSVGAADVDADGLVDVVFGEEFGHVEARLYYYYNEGDGRAWDVYSLDTVADVHPLAIGEMTGDDQLDVLYGGNGVIRQVVHRARGQYMDRVWFNTNGWTSDLLISDLDRDGQMDAAALFVDGHDRIKYSTVMVLLSRGDQAPHAQSVNVLYTWFDDNRHGNNVALGDVDGDADVDILVTAQGHEGFWENLPLQIGILENDGRGRFDYGRIEQFIRAAASEVILLDVTTNGRLDVVAGVGTDDIWALAVLPQTGRDAFGAPTIIHLPPPDAISGIHPGDFNGDGQPDLITAASSSNHPGRMLQFINRTPIDAPRLEVSSLVRSEAAEFRVIGARRGEQVHFLYTRSGQGSSAGYPILGGITLDLRDPINYLGAAETDLNGEAALTRLVPPDVAIEPPVTFQSVIRRGPTGAESVKTPIQVRIIE